MRRKAPHRRRKNAAPKPSAAFTSVDQICRLFEQSGWPGRQAFEAAMILYVSGATVSEARRLFDECARWVQ